MMLAQAADLGPDPVEDAVIVYVDMFDEYGIPVNDGGSSKVRIQYCPWCGSRLPESKRERWSDELEEMGIFEPDDPRIPDSFRTDEWWREK